MRSVFLLAALALAPACGKAHPANRCNPTGSYSLRASNGLELRFQVIPSERSGGTYDMRVDSAEPPRLGRIDDRGGACILEATAVEGSFVGGASPEYHGCSCELVERDGQVTGTLRICRGPPDGTPPTCDTSVEVVGTKTVL